MSNTRKLKESMRTRADLKNKRLNVAARGMHSPRSPQSQKNKNTCLNSLIESLRESQLGCWLRGICGTQWSDIGVQLLKACFFLLFVWLLAELHMALPWLLVCGCLCDDPLRRAVNNAWTWTTAHVRESGGADTPR